MSEIIRFTEPKKYLFQIANNFGKTAEQIALIAYTCFQTSYI